MKGWGNLIFIRPTSTDHVAYLLRGQLRVTAGVEQKAELD